MSEISKLLAAYRRALENSQKRYEGLYTDRAVNARAFYNAFLSSLIRRHSSPNDSSAFLRKILAKDSLRFLAIDGHPFKDKMMDYAIFFAVAFGIPGEIKLGDPPTVEYKAQNLSDDVSITTYVPIPFAEFGDVVSDVSDNEQSAETMPDPAALASFATSEEDRSDLSNLDVRLMSLAEIYLAYKEASSESHPDIILWDQSISLQYQWVREKAKDIPIVRNNFFTKGTLSAFPGRALSEMDAYVSSSHPYSSELDLPAAQLGGGFLALQRRFVFKLHSSETNSITVQELLTDSDVSREEALRIVDEFLVPNGIAIRRDESVELTPNAKSSWEFVSLLFKDFCHNLFDLKDDETLLYETETNEGTLKIRRRRWISPEDISFLVGVGLRLVIESCWKNGIFFVGVVKDSQQRYFTRNYLGVMRHVGQYSFSPLVLPWTDRITLEPIAEFDSRMEAPWSTVDYDSTFVTVHMYSEPNKGPKITGGRRNFVAPERMFARSLAQFYIRRGEGITEGSQPLYSHVLFIDRILMPKVDLALCNSLEIDGRPSFGKIKPFRDLLAKDQNLGQEIIMNILTILSQNRYPEVIGYPEPLHLADWAAKSFSQDWAQKMIKSSGVLLKSKPLARTFREVRDQSGR